jgi:hypothetical protein
MSSRGLQIGGVDADKKVFGFVFGRLPIYLQIEDLEDYNVEDRMHMLEGGNWMRER